MDAPVLTNRTVRVVVENHRGHRVVTEEPGGTGDTGTLTRLVLVLPGVTANRGVASLGAVMTYGI